MTVMKAAPNQVIYYSMNLTFPFQLYSVVKGSKAIPYTDILCANLPKKFVEIVKFLSGGISLPF